MDPALPTGKILHMSLCIVFKTKLTFLYDVSIMRPIIIIIVVMVLIFASQPIKIQLNQINSSLGQL